MNELHIYVRTINDKIRKITMEVDDNMSDAELTDLATKVATTAYKDCAGSIWMLVKDDDDEQ